MRRLPKTDANLRGAPVAGMGVIRRVAPYLWPEGETMSNRVGCAMYEKAGKLKVRFDRSVGRSVD